MSYCPLMSYRDQSRGVIPCLGDRCQFANDKGECLISAVLSKALDIQIKSEQEHDNAIKYFQECAKHGYRGVYAMGEETPTIEFIERGEGGCLK